MARVDRTNESVARRGKSLSSHPLPFFLSLAPLPSPSVCSICFFSEYIMGVLSTPLGRLAGGAAVTALGITVLKGGDLASSSSSSSTSTAFALASLLATSVFVGANVWTTFASGIVMFRNLPKPIFGDLQAKLFPVYFAVQVSSAAAALAVTAAGRAGGARGTAKARATAAAAALALSLLNLAVLEPLTTAAMYDRRAAQAPESKLSEEAKKKANKRFGMLHGLSSLANLLALGAGVTVLWFTAESLAK